TGDRRVERFDDFADHNDQIVYSIQEGAIKHPHLRWTSAHAAATVRADRYVLAMDAFHKGQRLPYTQLSTPGGTSSSSMVARAVEAVARWSARWVPNAFVIACFLTLVAFGMVLLIARKSPAAAVGYWTKGFWELLEFTMQMALIVLTGYTVAVSPVAARVLAFIAGLAGTNRGAVALMGLVSMTASWLHWGLGLIAGPIFLQFLIRRHPQVDYRLAVAAGYLGSTCTWHAGLSGSAPLLMATPKNFMEAQAGLIPVSMTTFSTFNLALTAVVVTVMTVTLLGLYPRTDNVRTTTD